MCRETSDGWNCVNGGAAGEERIDTHQLLEDRGEDGPHQDLEHESPQQLLEEE